MNIRKKLPYPSRIRRRETLSLKELAKHNLLLYHMKAEKGALTAAEGLEYKFEYLPSCNRIIGSEGRIGVFNAQSNSLRLFDPTANLQVTNAVEMEDYVLQSGDRIHYILTESALHYVENNVLYRYGSKPGGSSMAVHRDRIFFGHERSLYWSFLFPNRGFKSTATQDSGMLTLYDLEYGNIVKILSVADELWLFRERGLTIVTANTDTLNFVVRNSTVRYNSIVRGSVAFCTEGAYFFTDEGLCLYGYGKYTKLNDFAAKEIDFSQTVYAGQAGGKYYASVVRTNGHRHVYAYDTELGCGRWIDIDHTCATSALCGFYLLKTAPNYSHYLYLLTGTSAPETGNTELHFTYTLGKEYPEIDYLEEITVLGEGNFKIIARADGMLSRAKGSANKMLRFGRALRGREVEITILVASPEFKIEGVVLGRRRDKNYDR